MEDLTGVRILVIDDEKQIRELLKIMLEREGCIVTLVRNGLEAMQLFSTARFDVVITDMAMPEKDGVETIIEIRQLKPPVGIIAMSGVDSKDKLLRLATAFEADRVIKKPFKRKELVSAVLDVLRNRSDDAIM